MGYGAFMRVYNTTSEPITLVLSDVSGMHDNGDQGSRLGVFNTTIPAGQTVPPLGGPRQYIEQESGNGNGNPSFQLQIQNSAPFATITSGNGGYEGTGYAGIALTINNNDPQAYIDVVLYQP